MRRLKRSLAPSVAFVAALLAGACNLARDEGRSAEQVSAQAPSSRTAPAEVQPPDILDLVQVGGTTPDGRALLEAIVRPYQEGRAELQLVSPEEIAFESGARAKTIRLSPNAPERRERLSVDVSSGRPITAQVRLVLYDEKGQPWLSMDKGVRFNVPAEGPAVERVPVVQTRPDGSRIVEYMTRDRAASLGLTPFEGGPAVAPEPEAPVDSGWDSPERRLAL
jgi:hypothetical protein